MFNQELFLIHFVNIVSIFYMMVLKFQSCQVSLINEFYSRARDDLGTVWVSSKMNL